MPRCPTCHTKLKIDYAKRAIVLGTKMNILYKGFEFIKNLVDGESESRKGELYKCPYCKDRGSTAITECPNCKNTFKFFLTHANSFETLCNKCKTPIKF